MVSPRFTPRTNEPSDPSEVDEITPGRTRKKQLSAIPISSDPQADLLAQMHSLLQREAYLTEQIQSLKNQLAHQERTSESKQARSQECFLEQMASSLVPIIDNCHRALAGIEENDPMRRGFVMLKAELEKALRELGINLFAPELGTQFDPAFHEAIDTAASDYPHNSIVRVVTVGYRKGEGVIQAAQVIVSE